MVKKQTKLKLVPAELKIDFGTGKGAKKPPGYIGVDINGHAGVDHVLDLRKHWPWAANSIDEAQADYLLQYFTQEERVHFANELFRVLKPGAKALILTPHWAAAKAYIDMGIQWPPISEGWYVTLNKAWRDGENRIDKSGLKCDFDHTIGYGLHPAIVSRNLEYQQDAVTFKKEAAQDLIVTLIKR